MNATAALPVPHLGLEDWPEAARQARQCGRFRADVEEELVADEDVSCYNCRQRRWAARRILCLAATG
jgi:hypothetical protein